MIRATLQNKDEFLVDEQLDRFDYQMQNRGPEMFFTGNKGDRFLANEVSSWKEVGAQHE